MTKFKVSPLVFLLALAMIFFGYGYEFISYGVAVVMHEMAHAEVSKRMGYTLSGIKLMPYGASLTGAFEGASWRDEFVIALAGPVSNIVIAVVFVAIWWLAPSTYFVTELFVYTNIFTAVFNLIPIFPLDGGRALLALLSRKIPRQKAYARLRIFGFLLAAAFAALFVFSLIIGANFSFAMISLFILFSTVFPDKNSKYQRLYSMGFRSEKIKRGLTVKEIMVQSDTTLLRLLRLLNGNYYHRFIVVNDELCEVARITETELEGLSVNFSAQQKICDILKQKSDLKH